MADADGNVLEEGGTQPAMSRENVSDAKKKAGRAIRREAAASQTKNERCASAEEGADSIVGLFEDGWTHELTKFDRGADGWSITASAPDNSWGPENGTISGSTVEIFGLNGVLANGKIEFNNGCVFTRCSQQLSNEAPHAQPASWGGAPTTSPDSRGADSWGACPRDSALAEKAPIAALETELQVALAENERLRAENRRLQDATWWNGNEIQISTPLSKHPGNWERATWSWYRGEYWRYWCSWCPICKRPLDLMARGVCTDADARHKDKDHENALGKEDISTQRICDFNSLSVSSKGLWRLDTSRVLEIWGSTDVRIERSEGPGVWGSKDPGLQRTEDLEFL